MHTRTQLFCHNPSQLLTVSLTSGRPIAVFDRSTQSTDLPVKLERWALSYLHGILHLIISVGHSVVDGHTALLLWQIAIGLYHGWESSYGSLQHPTRGGVIKRSIQHPQLLYQKGTFFSLDSAAISYHAQCIKTVNLKYRSCVRHYARA